MGGPSVQLIKLNALPLLRQESTIKQANKQTSKQGQRRGDDVDLVMSVASGHNMN